MTYFNQKYSDLIAGWPPVNIGRAQANGIEAGAPVNVTDEVVLRVFYAYVDTEDKDTGDTSWGKFIVIH